MTAPETPPAAGLVTMFVFFPALVYLGFAESLAHPYLDAVRDAIGIDTLALMVWGVLIVHALEAAAVLYVTANRKYKAKHIAMWLAGTFVFGLYVASQLLLIEAPAAAEGEKKKGDGNKEIEPSATKTGASSKKSAAGAAKARKRD
ncbi:hypothetical protein H9P43_008495 [Blastocladiella emersonii ATCC 22665]|nr:hypothetical protein H9P43_008495 [Blastocladiella emersonii ATCC 22665]